MHKSLKTNPKSLHMYTLGVGTLLLSTWCPAATYHLKLKSDKNYNFNYKAKNTFNFRSQKNPQKAPNRQTKKKPKQTKRLHELLELLSLRHWIVWMTRVNVESNLSGLICSDLQNLINISILSKIKISIEEKNNFFWD